MNAKSGFSRVDAIIAVACVALVLAQAGVINAGGRERSKREVCLANLMSLAAAWQTYSNDNSGKIPVGDVWYSWTFPTSYGGPQPAWVEWPHPFPHAMPPTFYTNYTAAYPSSSSITQAAWEHAIAEGTLWKYVGDYNIYRCPDGDKGAYVTYSMSQSMNCYPNAGGSPSNPSPGITNINQISKPAERFVFLDTGVIKKGAFFLNYSGPCGSPPACVGSFGDHAPCRHGHGTTFVFADQHVEYHKWTDGPPGYDNPATWGGSNTNLCYCDWRWFCKVTWGNVPGSCTNPNKHCEY